MVVWAKNNSKASKTIYLDFKTHAQWKQLNGHFLNQKLCIKETLPKVNRQKKVGNLWQLHPACPILRRLIKATHLERVPSIEAGPTEHLINWKMINLASISRKVVFKYKKAPVQQNLIWERIRHCHVSEDSLLDPPSTFPKHHIKNWQKWIHKIILK